MKAIITPSKVSGEVAVPPSKSFTHRAILIASLAEGKSVIKNPLVCEDTAHTLNVCKALGVNSSPLGADIVVEGKGGRFEADNVEIFVGNSGSTVRMAASLAALAKGKVRLAGNERLNRRPIRGLISALNGAGIKASVQGNGCPPVTIEGGTFEGGDIRIAGDTSSQFISSLLMISPYAKKNTVITVKGELVSKPYVDITLEVMRAFGVAVEREDYSRFFIKCGQAYKGREYEIEGDWSSASYFFAAAAITKSRVAVTNLNPSSAQGDKFFISILKELGNAITQSGSRTTVEGNGNMAAARFKMKDYPDIVQTLAVVAAHIEGVTEMHGIGHLIHKETDRINETKRELEKMGVIVASGEDSLTVVGGITGSLIGAEIDSHNDHRMAMAFTDAALGAEGESTINGVECVSKSYPGFFDDMKSLGAEIELVE